MRIHAVPFIIARQRRPPRLGPRRAPVPPARFVPHAHQCAPGSRGAPPRLSALRRCPLKNGIPRSSSSTLVVVSRLSLRPENNPCALRFAFRLPFLLVPKSPHGKKDAGPTIGPGVSRPRHEAEPRR